MDGDRIMTRAEALRRLQAEGYKIGKSKLYLDCRAGLLRLQPDRSILKSDLDSYCQALKRPDSWGGSADRRAVLYAARRSLVKALRLLDLVARQLGAGGKND
jgi:hypothetical protein